MKSIVLTILIVLARTDSTGYTFFCNIKKCDNNDLIKSWSEYPLVCLITDLERNGLCSGSIITPKFVLTAGHCLVFNARYIKYLSDEAVSESSDNSIFAFNGQYLTHTTVQSVRPVHKFIEIENMYKHPQFQVVEVDRGEGMEIEELKHDIGLVKLSENMQITYIMDPLQYIGASIPELKDGLEIEAVGFHMDQLHRTRLSLRSCQHPGWLNCMCALTNLPETAGEVCIGDSGGPVFVREKQIGIVSLGGKSCKRHEKCVKAELGTVCVFTQVSMYLDIINTTIYDPLSEDMTLVPLNSGFPLKQMEIRMIAALLFVIIFNQ